MTRYASIRTGPCRTGPKHCSHKSHLAGPCRPVQNDQNDANNRSFWSFPSGARECPTPHSHIRPARAGLAGCSRSGCWRLASQPASQPASQSASRPDGWPASQPAGQSASQLASWPAMASQPASQPAGQPSAQLASQLASQLAIQDTLDPGYPGTRVHGARVPWVHCMCTQVPSPGTLGTPCWTACRRSQLRHAGLRPACRAYACVVRSAR